MIGDDIAVTVIGVNGKQVRLGITAPENVPVHREEIYNKIKDNEERGNPGNVKRFKFEEKL